MFTKFEINKNNVNFYLNELSKEAKKLGGRGFKIDLILVGGASIILNYNFRNSSCDIDGYYKSDVLKQAIQRVAERLSLPDDWLNNDFLNTSSFTTNIVKYSEFYKEFNQCLSVRTVSKEYLIAMKLKSFRKYKSDISDIAGILEEDKSISLASIKNAVINLYGSYEAVSEEARDFLSQLVSR